jgi:energy-coupling factor transporter ATP-binding protein EcfA2
VLTEIKIQNFRGFKDLTIAPLKRVNLIIGQNNTGKTALLEALALLLADPLPTANKLPQLFRTTGGDWNENFWQWIVYNKNVHGGAVVRVKIPQRPDFGVCLKKGSPLDGYVALGQGRTPLELGNLPLWSTGGGETAGLPAVAFSTHPTNPTQDAIDYNRVVQKKGRKKVEALITAVEPRLEAIESLQTGKEPLLYADVGLSEMIPVTQMGQGFNRLLDIYSEIIAAEAKVLLIDEVENGIHHSVLETIWRGLFHASQEAGVQIFATTHSWECVLAADRAAREKEPYGLNLIRLDRVEDNIKATVIDGQALDTAKELHWEMR